MYCFSLHTVRASAVMIVCWLITSCVVFVSDFDACPLSPGDGLLADEDLDPAQRKLQQLKKRLDIELKVSQVFIKV